MKGCKVDFSYILIPFGVSVAVDDVELNRGTPCEVLLTDRGDGCS